MDPVVQWALGIMILAAVPVFGHLYKQISDVRKSMDALLHVKTEEIWKELRAMNDKIDLSNRTAADARVAAATAMGQLVTREELDRQINRLINEFDRRMIAALRHRPPVEDPDR